MSAASIVGVAIMLAGTAVGIFADPLVGFLLILLGAFTDWAWSK